MSIHPAAPLNAHRPPRCSFYERTPVEGGFRYDKISITNPRGDSHLETGHPPLAGDLIFLSDAASERRGYYRVIGRSWLHSSWGSTNWPYGEPASTTGPLLDIVVERATGLFMDEVADEEETDG